MRKLPFFLIVVCVLLMHAACKKNDQPSSGNPTIVGNWTVQSTTVIYYKNNIKVDEERDDTGIKINFKSDGNFTTTGPNGEEPETGKYQYSAANKTITITYNDDSETETAQVKELTANRLVIEATYTFDPTNEIADKVVATTILTR